MLGWKKSRGLQQSPLNWYGLHLASLVPLALRPTGWRGVSCRGRAGDEGKPEGPSCWFFAEQLPGNTQAMAFTFRVCQSFKQPSEMPRPRLGGHLVGRGLTVQLGNREDPTWK